jgi:hypothetical protein
VTVVLPPAVGSVAAAAVAGVGAVAAWPAASAGATGYRVQRQAEGSTAWVTLAPLTTGQAITYADPAGGDGTRYKYRVAADADGFRSAYVESRLANVLPADGDADNDELSNRDEFAKRTNPEHFDTDGDLMPDGWEARYAPTMDPLARATRPATRTTTGWTTSTSTCTGRTPGPGDSDGDGASDRDEIDGRADPSDPSDEGGRRRPTSRSCSG